MKIPALAPSLLSADFGDLNGALRQIELERGSMVHIDVMDGDFVPQISYGQPVVESLRPHTTLPFDAHLMVSNPERHIESFARAGADIITVHCEAAVHLHRIAQQIHALGKKAGIALVPSTPVSAVSEVLSEFDLALVMTVNPGFGGQKLIPSALKKVERLAELKRQGGFSYLVSVDGGVNAATLPQVLASGAEVVVSGSAFFKGTLGWNVT